MTTASLPAEPGTAPDTDTSAFRRLKILLDLAEGAWTLAVYESGEVQRRIVRRLREELSPLEVVEVSLSDHVENPHPLAILEDIDGAPIVSFSGVGQVLPRWGLNLDVQREGLARLPHRLLLWVTKAEQEALHEGAPNFYSRLSGVFHFPGLRLEAAVDRSVPVHVSQLPDASLVARLRPPVGVAEETDREQWIRHYRRRIHDLMALENAAVDLAHAWYDLAGLYEGSRRPRRQEAEAAYLEAARRFAAVEQSFEQANALLRAGLAARSQYDRQATIGHFSEAREILLRRSQNREVGVALLLLGEAYLMWDQSQDAASAFQEAQGILQEVGFRLGEAIVLQALGDLFLRTSRLAEAERSYGEALPLYREIEARLGEANVLLGLCILYLERAEPGTAFDLGVEVLELHRAIGARLAESADHGWLARAARAAGQAQRAAVLGREALALARSVVVPFNQSLALLDLMHILLDLDEIKAAEAAALLAWQIGSAIQEPLNLEAAIDLLKHSHDGFDPDSPPSEEDVRAAEELLQATIRRHEEELEARGEDVYSPLPSGEKASSSA